MRRALVAVLGSSVLLSLLAAASAGARTGETTATIKLGWNERARGGGQDRDDVQRQDADRDRPRLDVRCLVPQHVEVAGRDQRGVRAARDQEACPDRRTQQLSRRSRSNRRCRRRWDPGSGGAAPSRAGGASILHGVFVRAYFRLLSRPADPRPDRLRLDHGSRRPGRLAAVESFNLFDGELADRADRVQLRTGAARTG